MFTYFSLITLVGSVCFGGFVFPTFDNNRVPWTYWELFHDPIVMDSGFDLGLTNPHSGSTPFDFIFTFGETINVAIEPIESDSLTILKQYDQGIPTMLQIYGVHDGPGDPMAGRRAVVTGYGGISVLEKDLDTGAYFMVGSIQVIPEPMTALLLLTGCIFCHRKN